MNIAGLPYTGIGSRSTPPDVLAKMRGFALALANHGMILRSGAAAGSDSAFEAGCDAVQGGKEIFLPWNGFRPDDSSPKRWASERGVFALQHGVLTPEKVLQAERTSANYHPAWHSLSSGARALHTRNVFQILGVDLNHPTTFVLCWAVPKAGGGVKGGTGQAVRLAQALSIPVFNLAEPGRDEEFIQWVKALRKK